MIGHEHDEGDWASGGRIVKEGGVKLDPGRHVTQDAPPFFRSLSASLSPDPGG